MLEGGAGADELFGSAGFDFASYRNSGAGVLVDLALGIVSGGDAAGDKITGIEGVIGSALGDEMQTSAGGGAFVASPVATTFSAGRQRPARGRWRQRWSEWRRRQRHPQRG